MTYPEQVRSEVDGSICGYVQQVGDRWSSLSVEGVPIGLHSSRLDAIAEVHRQAQRSPSRTDTSGTPVFGTALGFPPGSVPLTPPTTGRRPWVRPVVIAAGIAALLIGIAVVLVVTLSGVRSDGSNKSDIASEPTDESQVQPTAPADVATSAAPTRDESSTSLRDNPDITARETVNDVTITAPTWFRFPLRRTERAKVVDGVAELQQMLLATGYDPGPIDGIFGEFTDQAVRGFQRDQGYTQTGTVTPGLWVEIAKAEASAPSCTREALFAAAQLGGSVSFEDFALANANACAPRGWAIASARSGGALGNLYLFRVRGAEWQLVATDTGFRTVTNRIVTGADSPLNPYSFNRLFGDRGWPGTLVTPDEAAQFIFDGVLRTGLSEEAVNEIVDMWFDDSASRAAYREWQTGIRTYPDWGQLFQCERVGGNFPHRCTYGTAGGVSFEIDFNKLVFRAKMRVLAE